MHRLRSRNEPGLSDDPRVIHEGGNSGYQAIGLAHAWGATRIVLLGYDMGYAGTHSHFHGAHAHGLPNPPQDMARWRDRLAVVARERPGLVVNATRGGLLGCFARVDLAAVLSLQK